METPDTNAACGSLTNGEYATAADGSRPQLQPPSQPGLAADATQQAQLMQNECEVALSILQAEFDNLVKAGAKPLVGEVKRQGVPGLMIFLPGVRIPESGFWTLNHDQKG